MITSADQLAIAVEDEVKQAVGSALLLKCLLNPLKGLSDDLRRLNNLYPDAAQVVRENKLATGNKKPADNSFSQLVGDRLKARQKKKNSKRKGRRAEDQMGQKAKLESASEITSP